MMRFYLKYILCFFVTILLQVLVMDNIQFSGYLVPFVYLLFILLLPFETPKVLLLVLAFIAGITVDLFNGVPGIHASASVFMAFLRPVVLKNFSPHEGYESGTSPRIYYYGFEWFAKYTFLLVLGHSFFLFFVESFSFIGFFHTLIRIILSTALTGTIIILSQFFIFRK